MALPSLHHWNLPQKSFFRAGLWIFEKASPDKPGSGPSKAEVSLESLDVKKLEALELAQREEILKLARSYNKDPERGAALERRTAKDLESDDPARLIEFQNNIRTVMSQSGDDKPSPEAIKHLQALEKNIQTLLEIRSEIKKKEAQGHIQNFQSKIDRYNKEIRRSLHRKNNKHELKLKTKTEKGLQVIDFPATLQAIEENLGRLIVTQDERDYLIQLEVDLREAQTAQQASEASSKSQPEIHVSPEKAQAAGDLLRTLNKRIEAGRDDQRIWQNKALYQKIGDTYNASKNRIELGSDAQGEYSTSRDRENLTSFLTVMQLHTKGFERSPAHAFSENYQENIKRYPTIYRHWLMENTVGGHDLIADIEAYQTQIRDLQLPAKSLETLLAETNRPLTFKKNELSKPSTDQATRERIDYWKAEKSTIEENLDSVSRIEARETDGSEIKRLERLRDLIKITYLKEAELQLLLAQKQEGKNEIDQNFTRSKLAASEDDTALIEAMMMHHKAIIDVVDRRVESGDSMESHNPAIRTLLIARFHEKGVGPSSKAGDQWIIDQVLDSSELNHEVSNKHLTTLEQHQAIEIAFVGGAVFQEMDTWQTQIEKVDDLIALNPNLQQLRDHAQTIGLNDLEAKATKYTSLLDLLKAHKENLNAQLKKGEQFLRFAKLFIKNPSQPDLKPFIEAYSKKGFALNQKTFLAPGRLTQVDGEFSTIEVNHGLLEHEGYEDADTLEKLKGVGIDIRYAAERYGELLEENPNANLAQWDKLLKDDPNALADILAYIIPPPKDPKQGQGREALIDTIRSLKDNPNSSDISIARTWVTRLKGYLIQQRTAKTVAQEEIEKIKNDLKKDPSLKNYAKKVYNWLSRKFWQGNLLVKGFMAFLAFTVGSKMLKKEGFIGVGGIIAGLGLGAGVAYEEWSGNRVISQLKGESISERAELTFEGAIADFSREKMQKVRPSISHAEHVRAQIAMRTVPYHKLMEWYDAASPESDHHDPEKAKRLYQKLGITDRYIVNGALPKDMNKQQRTYQIALETMHRSVEFVGYQRRLNAHDALFFLKDNYVDPLKNKEVKSAYPDLYERFHNKPDELTLGWVMEKESSYLMIKKALGTHGIESYANTATAWLKKALGYSEEKAGEAQAILSKFARDMGVKLTYLGDAIYTVYKNHEWEIKHLGEGAWSITRDGIMLGPKLLGKELEYVIPEAQRLMNQGVDVIFSDEVVWLNDAMSPKVLAGQQAWPWENGEPVLEEDGWPFIARDEAQNPQFDQLGYFQYPFWKALKEGAESNAQTETYHTQVDEVDYLMLEVNAVSATRVGDDLGSMSASARFEKMKAAGLENAVNYYVEKYGENLRDYFQKYLRPIANFAQKNPERLYIAYYLPTPTGQTGSKLQSDPTYQYEDPNQYKHERASARPSEE